MQIRIYYEDTDLGGIVYHSNYINYCERARSELFFQKDLLPHDKDEFFVVRHIEANYLKPAKFADILDIKTSFVSKKNTSLTLLQEIYRDDEVIFNALVTVVFLKNGKANKIPSKYLEILL